MFFYVLCSALFAQDDTLWEIIGTTEKNKTQAEEPTSLTTEDKLAIFDSRLLTLPMSYDTAVVEWIEKLSGKQSKNLRSWIASSGKYENEIRKQLKKHNLPSDLLYLAMIESGFNTTAVSSAEAVGVWQFIPSTGRAHGLRIDGIIDERRDPTRATEAAIDHLKKLRLELGYWHLAMAAYNAGSGLIQGAIIRHNTANYWYLCKQDALPDETQNYVPKIMAAAIITKSPKLFDFTIPKKKSAIVRTMVPFVPEKSTSIATLSEYANTDIETFKEWNPHILASFLPRSKESVRIYLSPSSRTIFVKNILKNKEKREGYNARVSEQEWKKRNATTIDLSVHAHQHIVQENETLETIANRYKISAIDLAKWNQLESTSLTAGMKLQLLPPSKKTWVSYQVKNDESLKKIAKKYDCKVEDIKKWNALDGNRLRDGQIIYIKVLEK